jgi:hypothetical protein
MILTHPFLFNCIVVLFIIFTSAWIAFVIHAKRMDRLKNKIAQLRRKNRQAKSC